MTKQVQGQNVVAVERRERNIFHTLNLGAFVASTSDAIIALDQNFQVCDLNPSASRMLGWDVSDARGRGCAEVLRCKNLDRVELCGTSYCPLVRVIQEKQPLPHEELIIGTRPEYFCEVSTSVTRFQNEEPHADAQHFCDKYQATTDAERYMDKVGLASDLNSGSSSFVVFIARDLSALKVANQVRSNFVSMVSHELRTPLNSVHGFIDLILHEHMGPLNEEQKIYLSYTQQGVQQLVSIVEDILFMTRSDLGQFQLRQEVTPLRALVRQVVSGLQPQLRKAEVVLRQEIASALPSLYIDPQRIIQVLNNLIVNAIKFTPPGGSITVKAQRQNTDFVRVSVSDTGYGIPLEDQQHVFERFYQSNHHQQSKMGGYGLGLSIAQLIVEQHGGTIGLESVVNEGTTFYFTMPIYKKHMAVTAEM